MPRSKGFIHSSRASKITVVLWGVLSFIILFATAFAVWYGNADTRSRAAGGGPYFGDITGNPSYYHSCEPNTSQCIMGAAGDSGRPYQSCIIKCEPTFDPVTHQTVYKSRPVCKSGYVCDMIDDNHAELVSSAINKTVPGQKCSPIGSKRPVKTSYRVTYQERPVDANNQLTGIKFHVFVRTCLAQYCSGTDASNAHWSETDCTDEKEKVFGPDTLWETINDYLNNPPTSDAQACTQGKKRAHVTSTREGRMTIPAVEGAATYAHEYRVVRRTCVTDTCQGNAYYGYRWEPSDCTDTTERVFPPNSSWTEINAYVDSTVLPTPSCIPMLDQCSKGDLSCGPKISGKANNYRNYKSCVKQTICGKETWVWSAQKKGTVDLNKCK